MSRREFAAAGVSIVTGLSWFGLEIRWRLHDAGIGFWLPVYQREDD